MNFQIKVFADGADKRRIVELYKEGFVSGFTTNPSLMRKAGVADYESFCREILAEIRDLPFSFEVFSDDFSEMERQARKIATWGENVYVKIPITNTEGRSAQELIRSLSHDGIKLNITAILTVRQVCETREALSSAVPAIVSVFAGRIADTGVDPVPIIEESKAILRDLPETELLWASCRELFNIVQAERAGCDIITVTHDVLNKRALLGKPLAQLSLETVKMFYDDACSAGFQM